VVSKAVKDKSRWSITSRCRSSITDLAIKLHWLPPSSMQHVSLLEPVGPVIHSRAVCMYVKSGEEISTLPTEAEVIGFAQLVIVSLSMQTDQ